MKQRNLYVSSISFFFVPVIIIVPLLYGQISEGAAEQQENAYVWVSMDGPPGGGVTVLKQNPYRKDELYAGASPGFFVSNDHGTTFRRVGIPTLTDVINISLAENFAVVTADFVYSYDYQTEDMKVLLESPARTFLHGDDLYIITYSSSENNKLECGLFRIAGLDPTARIDLDTQVPLAVIQIDMPVLETQTLYDITIGNILMVEETLLMTFGFTDHTGIYTYAEHMIFAINTADGSYRIIDPGLPDDLVLTRISPDPENPQHLVLVTRNKRIGDIAERPISKLIYESTDGGSTWDTFTNNTEYRYYMIKDVDFSGGRIFFSRVADWILSVDASDHSSWERMDMPSFGAQGTSIAWLDWLNFDTEDSRIVYGGLDLEAGFTGVIRSTDSMQSWEIIGDGIPSSQPSNIDIHPENSNILVTSGNIAHYPHITRDGGATWHRLLEETSMGDELVFDPHHPSHLVLVSELTDLFQTWDMGENWEPLSERFHASRVFDMEASSEDNGQLFASLFGIGISRFPSLNNREQILSGPMAREQWEHMYGSSDYAYDIELDPEDNRILYASYSPKLFENHASIFRYDGSANEEAGWEEILRVENSTGISSIAIDQKNHDRMYAGVTGERGRILASQDRGDNWETLSENLTFSTIHEMAIDPTNDLVAYAAPWGGGLFKTTDGGTTWTPLEIPTVSVASIVINPNEPDHIYIGDRTRPYVFETHDGGREWVTTVHLDRDMLYRVSSMALHKGALYISVFNRVGMKISLFDEGPMSGTTFELRDHNIRELKGDMTRAAIGLCSTGDALYAVSHIRGVFALEDDSWVDISGSLPDMGFNSITTDDNGTIYLAGGCDISLYGSPRVNNPLDVNNIYMSQNEGATWAPLLEGNDFGSPVKKVLAHPVEQDMLVAASANGIFISRNCGRTWHKQDDGLSFRNIGALALGQSRVYAGTLGGGVFAGTIEQGTVAWSGTTGPYPEIYNIRIALDPSDSQVIYATAYPGGVFKSHNGGLTWAECNFGLPSFQVIDPFLEGYYDLAVNPDEPDILFLGIYGHGIYFSRDAAATWIPIYAINDEPILRDLKTKRVVFDPLNENHVYTASDKGVLFTGDLGLTWEALNAGLDTHDIISLEISDDGSVFAGSNGYGVYSLNKETKTWTHMNRTTGFGNWAPWERRLYMYTALLFDPSMQGRIYMGNFPGGFFVSNDEGNTWECSSLGLGNDGIFSLTMHPYNQELIFAGTYNGIWKTENQGKSWSQTSSGMPAEQWPFCVVIDDQDPSIMYTATKNGMNKGFMNRNEFGGVVMKSIDGGENWFEIMDGLRTMSEYYQLIIHPDNHNILFVSSTFGVFISKNAGLSWESFNAGLPVQEFFIRDNVAENLKITPDAKYLVFGITAHGVWRIDITRIADN